MIGTNGGRWPGGGPGMIGTMRPPWPVKLAKWPPPNTRPPPPKPPTRPKPPPPIRPIPPPPKPPKPRASADWEAKDATAIVAAAARLRNLRDMVVLQVGVPHAVALRSTNRGTGAAEKGSARSSATEISAFLEILENERRSRTLQQIVKCTRNY